MPSKKLGFNLTLNRDTGTFGSPAWTPLIALQGIKYNRAPAGTPDSSDRLTNLNSVLPTRYNLSVDADGLWNKGAGLTALRTAFLAGSVIDLAVLDAQPATAGVGHRGEWMVTKFMLDFPLVGDQKVSINIQPHANFASGHAVAAYTDATVSPGTAETPSNKREGYVASVNDSTHAPLTAIRDWKLNLEQTVFDASDRADKISKILVTKLKISAELNFIWDRGDTQLVALETAFLAHNPVELWLLDGAYATSGSWGVHGDMAITDFPNAGNLEDGQNVSLKIEPHGNATNVATFVTL